MDEHSTPRKRKRYKVYGEPGQSHKPIPRTSAWRYSEASCSSQSVEASVVLSGHNVAPQDVITHEEENVIDYEPAVAERCDNPASLDIENENDNSSDDRNDLNVNYVDEAASALSVDLVESVRNEGGSECEISRNSFDDSSGSEHEISKDSVADSTGSEYEISGDSFDDSPASETDITSSVQVIAQSENPTHRSYADQQILHHGCSSREMETSSSESVESPMNAAPAVFRELAENTHASTVCDFNRCSDSEETEADSECADDPFGMENSFPNPEELSGEDVTEGDSNGESGDSDDDGANSQQNSFDSDGQRDQPKEYYQYHAQLRQKLLGDYAERIQNNIVASRGELLLNIQEFCNHHPLPLTAQEDLHALVNSLFYQEIIPESKYKIDKLYCSEIDINYIFYCQECFQNFGELDYKKVRSKKCPRPNCGKDNIIGDLTKAHFFVIIDFIDQLQLLLENPEISSQLKNPSEFQDNADVLKDIYDGEVYKEFIKSLDFSEGISYLSLTGSTDGTPLFNSSTLSVWPLFVSVNELPPHIRMCNVFLSGLWFGRKHPKMDLFLEGFADYVTKLSNIGFYLKIDGERKLYKAYLLAFCADSGARGSIHCVKNHNGHYPCNWCLHPGQTEGGGSNARKFPVLCPKPEKRTMQQMIRDGKAVLNLNDEKADVNGVTGVSPLLRCPKFNIVNGMILDELHWAAFGVARRMCKLWLGETKTKKKKNVEDVNIPKPNYYIGTDETKSVINGRISKLRVPCEFRRMPRDLAQLGVYNAREFENFILYTSVPLFKNILPELYLKHWTLFVQAFFLLMKTELNQTDIEVASILFEKYLSEAELLYGEKEMTFNMHISEHAAENALRWGALWLISSFAFENANGRLKLKIHSEKGIPHQIIRSLNRDSALSVLRSSSSTPQSSLLRERMQRKGMKKFFYSNSIKCMRPAPFYPTREEEFLCNQLEININQYSECKKIIVEHRCYSVCVSNKLDNSVACCRDGTIVKIRRIIASDDLGKVFLFWSKIRCIPYSIPRINTNIKFSPFMFCVDLIENEVHLVSSDVLKTVCVFTSVDCRFYKGQFVSVMPYTMNVF